MGLEVKLVQDKLYAAISSAREVQQQPFTLRPSNIGYCPLRLRFDMEAAAEGMAPPRDPKMDWRAFQGALNEDLFRVLLEMAGAVVIAPPRDSDYWHPRAPVDPETGFAPHLDAMISWPEVGLEGWHVLELKNLRATEHNEFFAEGLYPNRGRWFQAVSYLMLSQLAVQNYSMIELDRFEPGPWTELYQSEAEAEGILFLSIAKDPASATMLMGNKTKIPQYESKPPAKGYSQQQLAMMEYRKALRVRLEEFDNNLDFYIEHIPRNDPSVVEAWQDIRAVREQVLHSPRPEPLYNIAVSDDDLPAECRWYCPWLEKHRMLGLQPVPSDVDWERFGPEKEAP